ncbi:MAG: Unknown protein [uncultured Sulfurovum sp.]|uniref:DUF945 domain-containing protein n=1 Tax=uncultured Sulfurovum sp. TaxID=269237 RepID=A0A6S6TRW1_9BACT|nr:MAG: Unknown protein [uncultured Sulfurovum sp.]
MAKFTKIIASLIGVSALWLGGTAYISSNTKSYLNTYIAKSSSLYNANGMQMHVENFEKGFFSSNAKIKIDFVDPTLRETISETFKLPIELDYKIENGPLFFKNGLSLGSSRISSTVNLSSYLVDQEAFKKIFKEDIELTSMTSIDFFNNASFTAKTNKILANVDGDEVQVSPLTIEGDMNIETFQGQMKMLVDSVLAENKTEFIKARNIVLDADIKKFYDNGFYLGNFVLSLGSLDMKDELLPFELNGAKGTFTMDVEENKNKTIDMKFNLHAKLGDSKLPKEYSSLNEVELSYALNGTKLEGLLAFQDFTTGLQVKQQEIMRRLKSSTTGEIDMKVLAELEKVQTENMERMMVLMAGLLHKDSSNLNIEMKMIDKKEKSSHLEMNLAYVGDEVLPTTAKALEEKFRKEFLNLVNIELDVELEKDYIANLPLEFQQELAGQLQVGAMFGVVQENNSSFSFDASYQAKRLMLNGKDRSEMLQLLEQGLLAEGI